VKSAFLKTPVEPALLASYWAFCERVDLSPSVSLRLVVWQLLKQAGYEVEDYDPKSERRNDYAQWARRRRPEIDENGANPVLITRVPPGMLAAFSRYASARNQGVAAAFKAVAEHVVRSAGIENGVLKPPEAPDVLSSRLTISLSKREMDRAEQMAADFGSSVREWVVALVRSRVAPEAPQFSSAELTALYASNRELWAIGRNMNQIAHAMNLDIQQAGRLQGARLSLEELRACKAAIDAHTDRVLALCAASLARWEGQ
jgi:hypothetical protein